VSALGWTSTVPAHSLLAPVRARVIAAAPVMPGVWGVFGTRSSAGMILTPLCCQSIANTIAAIVQEQATVSLSSLFPANAAPSARPRGGIFQTGREDSYGRFDFTLIQKNYTEHRTRPIVKTRPPAALLA
jgi:hypothetical protein